MCGFTETGDEQIGDHLFEVFAPDDGKGPDGLVHLEGNTGVFCMCGTGGSVADLDAHFLAVFTPGDSIGRDGNKHEPVSAASPPWTTGALRDKGANEQSARSVQMRIANLTCGMAWEPFAEPDQSRSAS